MPDHTALDRLDQVRSIVRLAAATTFLAVVMGSLVCATASGAACPTWPGCYPGRLIPEFHQPPMTEFTHRLVAMAATLSTLWAALVVRRTHPHSRLVRTLPWVAFAGCIAAGVFGMSIVLFGLPKWLGVIDLFSSLVAMLAMAVMATAVERTPHRSVPSTTARLAGAAVGGVVAMHLLGVVVAADGSYTRCLGWPLWQIIDTDHFSLLQGARITLAVACVGLIIAVAARGLRRVDTRGPALVALGALAGELALGATLLPGGLTTPLAALYSTLAVTVLAAVGLLGARAGLVADPQGVTPRQSLQV